VYNVATVLMFTLKNKCKTEIFLNKNRSRRKRKDGQSTGLESIAKGKHKGKRSWKNHARERVLEIVYKV